MAGRRYNRSKDAIITITARLKLTDGPTQDVEMLCRAIEWQLEDVPGIEVCDEGRSEYGTYTVTVFSAVEADKATTQKVRKTLGAMET